MANRQTRRLLDLLDGFEMTKSQHDWLERRFENMTVKESLLFRGAMQIEQPRMTCDVMLIASQLDHYDLFYGAGDDARLGKFIMEQIQRPASQARAFLDPEKVGAAYRQKGGNTFCDGHFIRVTSLIDPFLDGAPTKATTVSESGWQAASIRTACGWDSRTPASIWMPHTRTSFSWRWTHWRWSL